MRGVFQCLNNVFIWRSCCNHRIARKSSLDLEEDEKDLELGEANTCHDVIQEPFLPQVESNDPKLRNRSNSATPQITLSFILIPDPESLYGNFQEIIQSKAFPNTLTYTHAYSSSSLGSMDQRAKILKQILRFHRDIDKLNQLASILLKSRAYHLYHNNERLNTSSILLSQNELRSALPITELPRTQYNKPFIPNTNEESNHTSHTLSISHQEPIIATVQFLTGANPIEKKLFMGLDIVVSTSKENELKDYNFLQNSFTRSEWRKVSQHTAHTMEWAKDILLIWCMKEAYTKALGLGMGLEFSKFEIQLDDIQSDECTWNQVVRTGCFQGIKKRGRVLHSNIRYLQSLDVKVNRYDYWNFTFFDALDLCTSVESSSADDAKDLSLISCACVCDGPYNETLPEQEMAIIPIDVEIMSLSDLMQWHSSGNKINSKKA